jgi:biotin transport system substrate-specific component
LALVLTIVATWMEAFTVNGPWSWGQSGIAIVSLGVSFQVGAVLLTGCVGGKNAAALSQIAYLVLGLALFQVFEFPVFTQGGGLSYVREPGFGYLVGFVPAGWVCGYLAFQDATQAGVSGL